MVDNYNQNIIPLSYDIFLNINTYKLKYKGNVSININITNDTDHIILNSQEIIILNIKINNVSTTYKNDTSTNTIYICGIFKKGHTDIFIEFDNIINNELEGIYYSKIKQVPAPPERKYN